jgi:LPXTG-motif cell wall-anchored protein
MMWAKRILIGSGVAVASLLMASSAAGAATCVVTQTLNEPACTVVPTVAGNSGTPAAVTPTDGDGGTPSTAAATTTPSSLPFTGADVEELAIVGAGAVLAGGLLMRRRRRSGA